MQQQDDAPPGEPGDPDLTLTREEWAAILNAHCAFVLAELPDSFPARVCITWLQYAHRGALISTLDAFLTILVARRNVTRTEARGLLCDALGWSESTLARHLRPLAFLDEIDADADTKRREP